MTTPPTLPERQFKSVDDHRLQMNNLFSENWMRRSHRAETYRVTLLAGSPAYPYNFNPGSDAEVTSQWRTKVTTTGAHDEFRIVRNVYQAAGSGSKLRVKYWTGSAFDDLAATTGAGDVLIDSTYDGAGSWATIATGALHNDTLTITIYGESGSGTCYLNSLAVEFRL